jgi:1,4-alpha-glucan branching enzyme
MIKRRVQFKLYAPDAGKVALAGDFNQWNPTKKVLRKNENGEWTTRVVLAEGRVEYKFLVDGKWINDPGAKEYQLNGVGSENSIRYI